MKLVNDILKGNDRKATILNDIRSSIKKVENTYVYPEIDKKCFNLTMENFREQVAYINEQLPHINKPMVVYNDAVDRYCEKNKKIAETIQQKRRSFEHKNERIYLTKEYNNLVQEYNDTHGLIVHKRLKNKIKFNVVPIFEAILFSYKIQLSKLVAAKKKRQGKERLSLPMVYVNPQELRNLKRNGKISLDVCSRTIRRHRNRLEDHGILNTKVYQGYSRPVYYFVNSQILAINDAFIVRKSPKSSKSQNPSNQFFNNDERTNSTEYKVSSSVKTNIEKKGIVNSLDDEKPLALPSNFKFFKSTTTQDTKTKIKPAVKNAPAAEKNQAGPQKSSEVPVKMKVLQSTPTHKDDISQKNEVGSSPDDIKTDWKLAQELAAGEYNNYIPLDFNHLRMISRMQDFTSMDLITLVVHDLTKTAARLYIGNEPVAGSWKKAINEIRNTKTHENKGLYTFKGGAMTVDQILTWHKEMRFRLNFAIGWFTRREWDNVIYPCMYFDRSRTNANQVSFAYTQKMYSARQKKRQDQATKKQKAKAASDYKQKVSREDYKKLNTAISKLLRKEYTWEELYTYCRKNLKHLTTEQIEAKVNQKIFKANRN